MTNAVFWDKSAKKYAATPIKDIKAYEDTLDRARHYLQADDHLLEVGCGTGTTAITLATDVRWITATDISDAMLAIAKDKQRAAGITNLTFLQSEILGALADAPFDVIFASSILHLVDDLDATLAHLFSQLNPGGYIISKTACLREMSFLIPPVIKVMQFFGKAPPVLVFSADALEQAFVKAGFRLVETGYFGKNRSARFIVAQRPPE